MPFILKLSPSTVLQYSKSDAGSAVIVWANIKSHCAVSYSSHTGLAILHKNNNNTVKPFYSKKRNHLTCAGDFAPGSVLLQVIVTYVSKFMGSDFRVAMRQSDFCLMCPRRKDAKPGPISISLVREIQIWPNAFSI